MPIDGVFHSQIFLRDASDIESWIESSESVVKDKDLGKSIEEVEELIRRHTDFIKTVEAQEDKLNPVKRLTKVCAIIKYDLNFYKLVTMNDILTLCTVKL